MAKRHRYRKDFGYRVIHDSTWAMAMHEGLSKVKGPFDKLPERKRRNRYKSLLNKHCPVCRQPLRMAVERSGDIAVWCGDARCKRTAANSGATGSSLPEALHNFFRMMESQK